MSVAKSQEYKIGFYLSTGDLSTSTWIEQNDLEQKIHIRFPKTHVHSFNFVFLEKEKNKWYNNNEQDYHLQIN